MVHQSDICVLCRAMTSQESAVYVVFVKKEISSSTFGGSVSTVLERLSEEDRQKAMNSSKKWAICSACFPRDGCVISCGSGKGDSNTSSMQHHLDGKHFCLWARLKTKLEQSKSQPQLADCQGFRRAGKRFTAETVVNLAIWMAETLQPLSAAENVSFDEMLENCFGSINLPSRRAMTIYMKTKFWDEVTVAVSAIPSSGAVQACLCVCVCLCLCL